jgi:regulatory protein
MARGRTDPAGPAAPTGTARAAALRLLGRREYTVAELRTRLLERGFPPDETAQAIDTLVAGGLADDRRAALAHIRTGSRVKGRGRHRLRQELERRGVSPELVADLLAAHSDDEERAALERLLTRKRPPGRLSMADRRRLFQQLLRRGFAADLIARVLKEPGTDF